LENLRLIEGAPPSLNNILDINRLTHVAIHAAAAIGKKHPTAMFGFAAKHGNCCGASMAFDAKQSSGCVMRVVTGDTRAVFGGVMLFTFPITGEDAETMTTAGMPDGTRQLFDCIVAPSFDDAAKEILSRKHGKCRLMVNPALGDINCLRLDETPLIRQVIGGFTEQDNYLFVLDFDDPDMIVTGERDKLAELRLQLAWSVGSQANSNTITIVSKNMLVGPGNGQHDRVGAAELVLKRALDANHGTKVDVTAAVEAVISEYLRANEAPKPIDPRVLAEKAIKTAIDAGHKNRLRGAAAYSDSFFPYPDAPKVLIDAGITHIFCTDRRPADNKRDEELRELCRSRGVTLYQLPDAKARGFAWHG
jgi:phosphoribosylaminoimidazolecarboxamide formyltransferase/IMP cyclohydrolase